MNNALRKQYRHAKSRHGRRKYGLSLCEGIHCCRELLRARPEWVVHTLFSESFADSADFAALQKDAEASGSPVEHVADGVFAELAATETPQGILCLITPEVEQDPHTAPADDTVLILDRLTDPGNMGTVLRTAWAIGLKQIWLTRGSTDPFSPKCIRAGMGAQFHTALQLHNDLETVRERLKEHGYSRLWLTMPGEGTSCTSPEFTPGKSGLVIGNEAGGVGECAGARAVTIPMPGGAESLNAAQAATIFLYEILRRRTAVQ